MQIMPKRVIAAILAVLLLFTITGCAKKDTISYEYDSVYAKFKPKTAMIKVDDYTITWEELFFYLCDNKKTLEDSVGEITDWTAILQDDMSYAEAIKTFAEEDAISGRVLEYGAKLLGAQLGETELAAIEANYEALVEQYGSEEAVLDVLKQNNCYSKELYKSIGRAQSLIGLCFTALYGANAENLSDEQIAEYTQDDGYLMAKHILLLTQNDDGTAQTDEEKAAVLADIEDIYRQLSEYEGDAFDAFFDELMLQRSEDAGGLQGFPGGYLFQNGDMVPEFYDTTLSLEVGTFSEPFATSYGYHIVYRIPPNYDTVPSVYYNQQMMYSLRYITASQMFEAIAQGWEENMTVTYSKEFESLDIAALFG